MSTDTPDTADSFEQFVKDRHDADKTVATWVEGSLGGEHPVGNAEAKRVAEMLAGEDSVLRIDAEQAGRYTRHEDVGAVLITLPKDPQEEQWRPVQTRLLSRVPRDIDIVVLADEDGTPWFFKDLADVRIVATAIDGTIEYHRVRLDPYSGDVYYSELTPPEIDK